MLVALFGTAVKVPLPGLHNCAEVPPFEGGPSQESTSPVRVTTRLIATMGQLKGVLQEPIRAGLLVFDTVTVTVDDVVCLPDASRATAVMV
jgi:hypothetical protein